MLKIKKALRAWLEVPQEDEIGGELEHRIRSFVEQVIYEAFFPAVPKELEHLFLSDDDYPKIRSQIEHHIRKLASDYVADTAERAINNLVNREEFIDEIVERIKRKQLRT